MGYRTVEILVRNSNQMVKEICENKEAVFSVVIINKVWNRTVTVFFKMNRVDNQTVKTFFISSRRQVKVF